MPKQIKLCTQDPIIHEPQWKSYPSEGYDSIVAFYAMREGQAIYFDLTQRHAESEKRQRLRGYAVAVEEVS
jgi:hypothetical protein